MLRMTIVRRPTQTLCNCPCLQCNQQEIDKEKNSQKCLHSLGRPGQMMMRLPHWAHICDTGADCWYCDDVTQILETCDKMIHGCDTLCDSTRPHWSETQQYLRHRKYFTGIFGHHRNNAHRCWSQNDPQIRSSCLVVAISNLFSPHLSGNILSNRALQWWWLSDHGQLCRLWLTMTLETLSSERSVTISRWSQFSSSYSMTLVGTSAENKLQMAV